MRRKWRWWLVLCLGPLLLTACWDQTEIEEQSNVLAIGFDTCGENQDCELMVTRQVAIPGQIPLGGGKATNPEETVVVFQTGGRRESESAARAQMELNRTMSYGHMRVWVISEEVARQGLERHLDFVRRLAETRRMTWMAVSEGQAYDVLKAAPKLERVPALYLSDMLDDAQRTGRLPRSSEMFFDTALSRIGEDPAVPLIRMAGPDRPQLAGLAVFRGDAMVGKLSVAEMNTYLQLQGVRQGSEHIHVDLPEGGWAVMRVFSRHAQRKVRRAGSRIQATVQIELECELVNLSPGVNWDRFIQVEAERRASTQVERRAKALTDKLQHQLRADVLGIGSAVQSRTEQEWRKLFAATTFQIEADVQVRRTGLSTE